MISLLERQITLIDPEITSLSRLQQTNEYYLHLEDNYNNFLNIFNSRQSYRQNRQNIENQSNYRNVTSVHMR